MGSRNRFEKRNDSFSFAPPAGGNLSTEGRRAARRSAGTRRAISPASAPETDLTGEKDRLEIQIYQGERLVESTQAAFLGPRTFN